MKEIEEVLDMLVKAVKEAEVKKTSAIEDEEVFKKAMKDLKEMLNDGPNQEAEEESEKATYELSDAITKLRNSCYTKYAYRKDKEDDGYIFITYDLDGVPFLMERTEDGLYPFIADSKDFFTEWVVA